MVKTVSKAPNRHSGNDLAIAKAYIAKASSTKDRGLEFDISFTSFKNMCRAKKCYFTGLDLTPENFSIDRVDSSKGYVTGNVVACHKAFNNFKSLYENKENVLDLDTALRGLLKVKKHIKKGE